MAQIIHKKAADGVDRQRARWGSGLPSLQFKASLLVITLILLVITTGMTFSVQAMSRLFYEQERTQTQELAKTLAHLMSPLTADKDQAALDYTIKNLVDTGQLSYVILAEPSGAVLAAGEAQVGLLKAFLAADGKFVRIRGHRPPKLVKHNDSRQIFVDVVAPILAERHGPVGPPEAAPVIGYLHLATASKASVRLQGIVGQLSRIALIGVLVIVPLSLLVTRRVVAPLNELALTAQAIANGTMDARSPVRSRDEIGQVAKSFNTMADRITATQMDLLQLNADLEERVQQRTRDLKELATKDPLTGLYNRRHFAEVMAREFAAAERYDSDLTCLMFDLDHFKQINDQFGHATGDEALVMLAQAITGALRRADVAARFGGDEFIVLLPQTSVKSASALAVRIQEAFREKMAKAYPQLPSTASVGAASLRTNRPRSYETLIHEADVAMYNVKQAGRKQVAMLTPLPPASATTARPERKGGFNDVENTV